MTDPAVSLRALREEIVACERCPRLRQYCTEIARKKTKRFQDWAYWGRPVPGFGHPAARILVIGLAPAAHGANRTGRMFTGDRSGDWLYRALHRAGFANQPTSQRLDDGLELREAYVTAVVRCAPPKNKPSRQEIENCLDYLDRELSLLGNVRVVVALGRIAFDGYLRILQRRGLIKSRSTFRFKHGAAYRIARRLPVLCASYHPSQQNTQTGKLTEAMFQATFDKAKRTLRELEVVEALD